MRTKNNTSKQTSPSSIHHSSSPSSSPLPPPSTLTESMLQDSIRSAENIIPRCTPASLFSPENNTREEANEFISAITHLQSSISFIASVNASSGSKLLVRSHELLQMAMKTLIKAFSLVVVSDHATDDLKTIADCLISCGYSKECAKIYKTARKSVVDESLYNLGLDKSSLFIHNHNKLDWETIGDKIKNWLSTIKIAMTSIFSSEKTLCDLIFSSSPPIRDSCFSDITKESAVSVFAFPEQIASKCKKTPEKLFKLLDLYEAISDSSHGIRHIFSSDSTTVVVSQSEASLERLKEAIQATLAEFETAIKKDTSKNRVTGGGVHPLTRYAMNYLSLLADYSSALDEILSTWNLNLIAPLPEEYFASKASKTAVRLAWMILVLLSKLDGMADIYKEVSLSYLFLANNLQYIVGKVRKSDELGRILGEDWVAKNEEKVRQYAASYERVGWSKVIAPLLDSSSSNRTVDIDSLEEVKERFRRFNRAFMEVQGKQTEWVVVDQTLREEIKESLARNVVSKYREMYARYRDELASEGGECVVRYAPEDLENYLWGLVFGCSDGGSRSRCRSLTTSSCSSPSTSSHGRITEGRVRTSSRADGVKPIENRRSI